MVKKRWEWPEKNELVMCTVTEVFDQGAYVRLDEYEDRVGMVHISEIASGWIKNIRRHVKEGQKTVCIVLDIDKGKEHIDLSIRRVKDSQRSWKSEQWKRERKAEKLLDQAAKRIGEDLDTAYEKVGFPLQESEGEIYSVFEDAAIEGSKVLEEKLELDDEWIDVLMELIETSVEPPAVKVKGYVDLRTPSPEGVEVISSALQEAQTQNSDSDSRIDVQYIGSPTYLFEVKAPTYKKAEKILKKASERAISIVEEDGGTGEFYTEREE